MENQKTRQEMIRDLQCSWQPLFKDLSIAEKRLLGELNDRKLLQVNTTGFDRDQIIWSSTNKYLLEGGRRFRIYPNYREEASWGDELLDAWMAVLTGQKPEEPKREEPKAPPVAAPYQFKAGDVCKSKTGIRIIVYDMTRNRLCSYGIEGTLLLLDQEEFERHAYKKIGELKDYFTESK